MTPFFGKRCFLTWVKKWVLLTVFLKSCVFFFWKHYFYSVFSKAQLFKNINCMMKKTENLWKIVGCFWTWQKGVFGGLFFWGFNVIVVCFLWVCHSSKSVKNACFSQFWGLFWGGFFLFICVWKVWVFLCFLFLVFFLVLVLFLFVCFVLFCGWMLLFLFLFFLVFFFIFFFFAFFVLFLFFFGGFKGQVRWPEGPPHLALNPPYFLVFVVCLLFLFFVVFICNFCFCH